MDRIIATVTLNKKGNPVLEEGKVDYPHQLHFFLTEKMVMEANSFIRKRWEEAVQLTKRVEPTTIIPW